MEKLNIAELLRECPTGMELDCTICDNVYFDEVTPHMIKCFVKNDVYNTIYFHHDGTYLTNQNAKCVIFPKGKTTWEGFQRPFKDGDIIYKPSIDAIAILKSNDSEKSISYVFLNILDNLYIDYCHDSDLSKWRFAIEEEKKRLFDAIKANGYKWNVETKTLEKLEKEKFDITTLKPFESRILVRSSNDDKWRPAIFGFTYSDKYYIVGGFYWEQCIPYKGNEHLLGTTNDCDDYFKTWE